MMFGKKKKIRYKLPYIADKELFAAVVFALKMMGEGQSPDIANCIAAEYYGLEVSDVAHYTGKRAADKRYGAYYNAKGKRVVPKKRKPKIRYSRLPDIENDKGIPYECENRGELRKAVHYALSLHGMKKEGYIETAASRYSVNAENVKYYVNIRLSNPKKIYVISEKT